MNYFIIEGKPNGEFNATNKAREDVEIILKNNKITPFYIESINGVQNKKWMKWKQLIVYKKNYKIWENTLNKLTKGDIVFLQYPIINTTLGIRKLFKKYSEKGVMFIAIIHDLDSLRCKKSFLNIHYKRLCDDDKYLLNQMSKIICHNSSMKKVLVDLGNDPENIVELQLFDYLLDFEPKKYKRTKNDPIIIAGNLSPFKAKYLASIKDLGVGFNLFGVGYEESMGGDKITYKGKFKPDDLLNHLEGGYGLVWDGLSINTCIGGFGEYLRYNNPHKASLYLTAGIPVIIWKEAALADFITKNKLGIAVNSLTELKDKINNISDKEYEEMLKNVSKVSEKTKKGMFLTEAINKIVKE